MSARRASVVVAWRDRARLPDLRELLGELGRHQDHLADVVVVHPRASSGFGPLTEPGLDVRTVPARSDRMRRAGLAAGGGPAVLFLEVGDHLLPGAVRAGVEALEAYPACGFVHGRVRAPAGSGRPGTEDSGPFRSVRGDHYVELLKGNHIGPACAATFRRSALTAAGIHLPTAADPEDHALYLRLARTLPVHDHGQVVVELDPVPARPGLPRTAHAEFALLNAQRRHLGTAPHVHEAYTTGMTRLVLRQGVHLGNQLRAAGSRGRAMLAAARFLPVLLTYHPRGIGAFLRLELLPWLVRRHPGWTVAQAALGQPDPVGRPGPELGIAETVRCSVPPRAAVLVLGAELDLDLGERPTSYLAHERWAEGLRQRRDAYLVVPRSELWSLEHHAAGAREILDEAWQPVWTGAECHIHRPRADALAQAGRILVTGYFSFPDAHATAGDLLVRDRICEWLDTAGHAYDIANAPPFPGGVDWRRVDPSAYSHVLFACGPFHPGLRSWELLRRFPRATCIGVNLSMLAPLETWNPFDVLIERDSSRLARPDLAFVADLPRVPVVGVCLREHADGTRTADAAVRALVASTPMAVIPIDTRLDAPRAGVNSTGQRSAAEVESLIARMDVVVTTRLHGLVLGLKHRVPVLAVDPGNEGFKICKQADAVGWPAALRVDELTEDGLRAAFRFCLTPQARSLAEQCATRGQRAGSQVRELLLAELARHGTAVGG
jgi:hypothetical protein